MKEKEKKTDSLVFVKTDDKELIKQMYKWQIAEDEKEMMCCTWLPENQTQEYSEEKFEIFFNSLKSKLGSQVNYAILKNNDSDEYLGWINSFNYNPRNFSIEISYYFPKENRRKGYGKIMMSLFLKTMFNFEKMNLNKIYAETYKGNIGSKKLLEQFGFHLDGMMREHYWFDNGKLKYDQLVYSLLRDDWGRMTNKIVKISYEN